MGVGTAVEMDLSWGLLKDPPYSHEPLVLIAVVAGASTFASRLLVAAILAAAVLLDAAVVGVVVVVDPMTLAVVLSLVGIVVVITNTRLVLERVAPDAILATLLVLLGMRIVLIGAAKEDGCGTAVAFFCFFFFFGAHKAKTNPLLFVPCWLVLLSFIIG